MSRVSARYRARCATRLNTGNHRRTCKGGSLTAACEVGASLSKAGKDRGVDRCRPFRAMRFLDRQEKDGDLTDRTERTRGVGKKEDDERR